MSESKDALKVLHDAYKERGIFLVLGAGVSVTSGLPNWPDLMKGVYQKMGSGGPRHKKLKTMPAPVLASLLEERTQSEREGQTQRQRFTELVREALYDGLSWHGGSIDQHNAREFVELIESRNTTLRAVSALCARQADGHTFEPNPQVKAVITFNLDNLLQAHSRAKYAEPKKGSDCKLDSESFIFRTVERPSASTQPGKTNVYHVHGSMRFDKPMEALGKHAPDQMVLTEQDYYDAFNDPTRIFNYTFLHLLREHPALFVGLSMDDENLRRLLHYSKQERARGLEAEGMDRDEIREEVQRHVALLLDYRIEEVNRAYEDSLGPLGVRVIWLASFEEIPDLLKGMYQQTGDGWSDVYGKAPA